jgi:hypothetical protein
MNLDFGAVLRRAWQITWNNKILWLFGILAGAASSAPNRPDTNFSFDAGQPDGGPSPVPFFNALERMVRRWLGEVDPNVITAIAIGLVCVGLIIALVLFILSVISTGALIGGIRRADAQGRVTFGEAWAIGIAKFWPVLLIGLVVAVIAIALTFSSIFLAATVCLAPLACVGFLLVAVLGVYTRLAQIAAVVDNLGVTDALSRAWRVITANLGAVIVLGLILVIIQFVAGWLLFLPALAVVAPAVVSAIGFANEADIVGTAGLVLAGLCLVIYIPIAIVVGGMISTWVTSVWTLAYQQLAGRAPAVPAPYAPPAA